MLFSIRLRRIFLFSLVGSSAFGRVHLRGRQDNQGGVVGAIPLCVVTAEGTLFTATSGVLPTDGCPSATEAAVRLPSFITIAASISGSIETFSQTVFPDLATLTVTETVTTGIAQADVSGVTSTVLVPIVVGPGGIGFVGLTGALPTDVSIDTNGDTAGGPNKDTPGGTTPGASPSGGGAPPGGDSSNNNNNNNGDDDNDGDDQ